MSLGRLFKLGAAAALLMLTTAGAIAQPAWPTKPIKLIVPASAGGAADAVGRVLADALPKVLGQPVVVENNASAASVAGTSFVARSNPDGYTLLIASSSIAILPWMRNDLPYNAETDLVAVSQITSSGQAMVVSAEKSPVKTLPELVKMLKEKPGTYNYASAGVGSTPHLMAELFMSQTGTQMTHVPYKSTGESALAVIGGQVDFTIGAMPGLIQHIKQGSMRALAVTQPTRDRDLPNVPSISEIYPDFPPTESWLGIFVRAGTPQPIIDRLNKAIDEAVHTPESVQRFANVGSIPVGGSQASFVKKARDESKIWEVLIKAKGIKAE